MTFRCKKGTANARGISSQDGFTVLTGSVVSEHIAPSFELANRWNYELRLRLETVGVIKDRVFQEDYKFKTASAAASVVMGLCISGNAAWEKE